MPVEIIVEDGSIVENANSYVSVDDARAYAEERAFVLSESDDTVGSLLIRAKDYIETFALKFSGKVVESTQSLQWPRKCAIVNNIEIEEDSIPIQVKTAQIELAVAIANGYDPLQNFSREDYVVSEKIGPIGVTYSDPLKAGLQVKIVYVEKLIAMLCNSSFRMFETIRA